MIDHTEIIVNNGNCLENIEKTLCLTSLYLTDWWMGSYYHPCVSVYVHVLCVLGRLSLYKTTLGRVLQ